MFDLLIFWLGLFALVIAFAVPRPFKGGALTLAYFSSLSMIHVPGALVFLNGGPGLVGRDATELGFNVTLMGLSAFVMGAAIAQRIWGSGGSPKVDFDPMKAKFFGWVARRMFTAGVLAYFVFIPISFLLPSATSLVSPFATLLVIGLWLWLYCDPMSHETARTLAILTLLPFLPMATLVSGGFAGYGVFWALSVVTFLFAIVRERGWFYFATPIVVMVGLSFFIAYMGQREIIRKAEWRQDAGLSDRLDKIVPIFTHFEFLDLDSLSNTATINTRLNQNLFVGAAVQRHQDGLSEFAFGDTVPLWALVPRAFWPDKPTVGGGGDVVSKFTGLSFNKNTSVGAGQVFEFYVNFGIPGVLLGFAALGVILMRLDLAIMRALAAGDMRGLLLCAMPGLTLVNPGGNLLEIIVGTAGAYIGARILPRLGVFRIASRSGDAEFSDKITRAARPISISK